MEHFYFGRKRSYDVLMSKEDEPHAHDYDADRDSLVRILQTYAHEKGEFASHLFILDETMCPSLPSSLRPFVASFLFTPSASFELSFLSIPSPLTLPFSWVKEIDCDLAKQYANICLLLISVLQSIRPFPTLKWAAVLRIHKELQASMLKSSEQSTLSYDQYRMVGNLYDRLHQDTDVSTHNLLVDVVIEALQIL